MLLKELSETEDVIGIRIVPILYLLRYYKPDPVDKHFLQLPLANLGIDGRKVEA